MTSSAELENREPEPLERLMKLLYAKATKPVNKGFLVFGLILLVSQIVGLIVLVNYIFQLPDNFFAELPAVLYINARISIVLVICLIGTVLFLRLKQMGWYILCAAFMFRLVGLIYDLILQAKEDWLIGGLMPVVDLLLLVYLFNGRPKRIFQIDRRKKWIPVIAALLIFFLEKALLMLMWE
jgi:hypothetical protein